MKMRRSATTLAVMATAIMMVSIAQAQDGAGANSSDAVQARNETLDQAQTLNPLSGLAGKELSGFRGRPLFSPSRRPVAPPVAAAIAQDQPVGQPNLRLTGVIESPDETVAVVQNLDVAETWQLRIGDRVSGWLVTSIDPLSLKLTLGDRDEEYRLFSAER